ncbi:MAG: hypothetical protein ACMUEM_02590 [Flavobacteriales bacterium AspAUS03]
MNLSLVETVFEILKNLLKEEFKVDKAEVSEMSEPRREENLSMQ